MTSNGRFGFPANSGEGKSSLLFEWLILVNIVKLIVKNECGEYTTEYNQLRKFVEKNTGSSAIDKFEVSEVFLNNGGEIKFGMLTHLFGAVFKKTIRDQRDESSVL